jgi:hypothetical protein
MTRSVITAPSGMALAQCLMTNPCIRHLPVVQVGQLVGAARQPVRAPMQYAP